MRKVILQMYISLDGFVSDAKGNLDWIFSAADEGCGKHADNLLDGSDVILLGRGLSKSFLDFWPEDKTEFGQKINKLPKIIFSKTMIKAGWPNVKISGDITEEISQLKEQSGKNLILYGGAGIVQSFIKLRLIDEYHLFVVPVILGKGLLLFNNLEDRLNLKLLRTETFSKGVVLLSYEQQ